ncbi:NAD(P)/FAD-dependent oxidoreductase [Aurantiacibacter zhengii]|uniref:NAD(P)/FAD-dependent oxidoreductase n=2 Tax=Erythrobacteraceae TaxID=335929 RepID=A0A418NTU5_9SPHN|nr:NAD(P)/FAD-dependent oxidoreductase [Aurantiacibacter zhengii]
MGGACMTNTVAIIGANAAGLTTAMELRRLGYDGRVMLFDAEMEPLYNRPAVSKEMLSGEFSDPSDTPLVRADILEKMHLELEFGNRVLGIGTAGRLDLSGGRQVGAEVMVVATGGLARWPAQVPRLQGIHTLRTSRDAMALREALLPGARVVVMGGGVIGCEVASSAVRRGCDTTIVDIAALPMLRSIGEGAGRVMATVIEEAGVKLRLGEGIASVLGPSRISGVVLMSGETLPCDVLVIGVGMVPNAKLANDAGAENDNGILIDAHCRTSLPGVLAVGDVTRRRSTVEGLGDRSETILNAQIQAREAASTILGLELPKAQPSGFWSDQFDINIQAVGKVDRTVSHWLKPFNGQEGVLLQFSENKLCGAVGFNSGRAIARIRRLLSVGDRRPPEELLRDPKLNG